MARPAALPSRFGAAFDAEYEALPESLKLIYTQKEYAWLPPETRAMVIEQETMPDWVED